LNDPSLPTSKYQFQGDLATRPFPEILFSIYHFRVPGVLVASRGQARKTIYLRDGLIVHAASSDLGESLGQHLLEREKITPEQYEETMAARRESESRYGEMLVERGLLSPADLYLAIRQQNVEIVWNLFAWTEGQVTFDIGDFALPTTTSIQIPVRQAIKEGVRRVQDVKSVLARVGRRDTILEACYSTDDLIETALRQEEYDLLRRVDGNRTLADLCHGGPFDSTNNARLLYGFLVLQFVRRVESEDSSGAIKIRWPLGAHPDTSS
jgi:hypothetical protein